MPHTTLTTIQARDTDFLLIRDPHRQTPRLSIDSAAGSSSATAKELKAATPYTVIVREIPRVFVAGQTEPQRPVYIPGAPDTLDLVGRYNQLQVRRCKHCLIALFFDYYLNIFTV
jgi:hypothetical protein